MNLHLYTFEGVTAALLLAGCAGPPTEPTTTPPVTIPAPTQATEPTPVPKPPAVITPSWAPGVAFDGRFELFEDWISQAGIDAMQGREVGVWIAAAGEPALRWSCTTSQVGARGDSVRGLGSGRPRGVVALTPAPPLPHGTSTCFALTPSCADDQGFPTAWPWGHETTTLADLPDANGDGNPEWATTLYVYPEVEILFGFGGSNQARADCSVLVGG